MTTPILLITGFLGSGKTTLINALLNKYQNLKISVILNEFGDINLESQFIKKTSAEIIELRNGCMCCLAKNDIPTTIENILKNSKDTEFILIEASGLSDPDPIKETLASPFLSPLVTLTKTICVIDCLNFQNTSKDHPLVLSQAGDSDLILLSKTKLAKEDQVSHTSSLLKSILPLTPQLIWDDKLDLISLLPKLPPREKKDSSSHHTHDSLEEFLYTSDKKFTQESLINFFSSNPEIYRAKGYFTDPEDNEFLLQSVAGQTNFPPVTSTPRDYTTAILCLGENLDQSSLTTTLNNLGQ